MRAATKTTKTKLISDDIDEFMSPPKGKKSQKRNKNEFEEKDLTTLIDQYQASIKKKKVEANVENNSESRQKILDLVGHQIESRKKCNENLLKDLSEIATQIDNDYSAINENQQKLEHLTASFMKCVKQAGTAYKQKLKALRDVCASFKKESEDMEANHKADTEKIVDELELDIQKLQNKLISESKRNSWESLRRSIFHAMQNDL